MINELASDEIAFAPVFPPGGGTPLQSSTLSVVAEWTTASALAD